MRIKLARTLGYCLGVRQAMNTAFERLSMRGGKVYSHGELIHNAPAMELLAAKGLKIWDGECEGSVIIRAHGLPPKEIEKLKSLENKGLRVCDATCPRVRRVQKLVAREAANGKKVIIWGKSDHPEVVGLVGHAGPGAQVISRPADVSQLPEAEHALLVAQTTQDLAKWPEVEKAVLERWPLALIKNTICEATEIRQKDVHKLAEEVDALVVIGGKTSGNTARLADIGRKLGKPTFLVESEKDLETADLTQYTTIGVAAGASTSTWQIAQILQALRATARIKGGFDFFWPRLLRVLVLSSFFASLGLASLALTAEALLGRAPQALTFSFFFFQICALHLFSNFFQGYGLSMSQALRFNDPDRTAFFSKYRKGLVIFTAFAALAAALAAFLLSPAAIGVMIISWLGAFIYLFLPRAKGTPTLARTLLGPLLLACGWGGLMVMTALPPYSLHNIWDTHQLLLKPIFAAGAIFSPVFALAIMGDVLAAQGDRIFGRPTLPTVFGEKAAKKLLGGFLAAWAIWLLLGYIIGSLPSLALLMIISGPLYNFFLLKPLFPEFDQDKNPDRPILNPALYGYHFEALMYGQLFLTGLLVLLWAN